MKRFFLLYSLFAAMMSSAAPMPYFRHLGARDGLAHPSVLAIAQDSLGRLWFGTENGISLFDGNRVVSVHPGSVIEHIACSSNGDIYFLSENELFRCPSGTKEIEQADPGPFSCLYLKGGEVLGVRDPDITNMLIDQRGNTWYTSAKGLFCHRVDGLLEHVDSAGNRYNLYESSQGDIWTGSRRSGLLRVRPNGEVCHYGVSDGLGSNNVRGVVEDVLGNIWIGTFQGLCRYQKESDSFINYGREDREGGLSHSSVFPVFVDRDGFLWAGTYYGGVNYIDTREGAMTFYPASGAPTGLSHPIVGHLMEGRDGSIWICTEGGGVNRLDPITGFVRCFEKQPFTNAKWLAEDQSSGAIFIATNQHGLFRLWPASGVFEQVISVPGTDFPMTIINVVETYGKDLILSTDDGIFLHSIADGRNTLLYPRTDGVRYAHIAVDGDRLWIASSKVVEFALKPRRVVKEYALEGPQGPIRPMRLLKGRDGKLYATSFGQGVFRLEGDGFLPFGEQRTFNGYQITPFSGDGFLVSGDDGIHILDSEGTQKGTLLRGKNLPLEALVMDSGLLIASDGTVYAGGTNGLVSFHSGRIGLQEDADLYFSELYVDGTPMDKFGGEVSLKGPQNRIDLYFCPKHLPAEFNWSDCQFRIQGLDNQWRDTEGPFIGVRNLGVGNYVFELRRRGSDVVRSSLRMDILPFWWNTWWARVLYFLIGFSLMWLLLRSMQLRRESARQQELNETKMRFFTTACHELRTPLTLIIAQLDSIFQSFRLPPLVVNKMQKARSQAVQMNELVTELIDFRKFEQDMVTLQLVPTHLNPFLREILIRFEEFAREKQILLTYVPDPEDPVALIDEVQMQKVVTNLVFNALKYTHEEGKVTVSVETIDSDDIHIRVQDNGIGIPPDDLPHIFDRFYQAGNQDDTVNGIIGSGIGLSLAKDITERHGGQLKVASVLGEGSSFTISLRRELIQENEHTPIDKERRLKVVVAEDNPEMSSLLCELLSVQYEVHAAPDGVEALNLVRQIHPVLLVSDVMMPRMDGKQLCASVKGDASLAGIPVILLTALGDLEEQLSGLRLGADDYIAKPFDSRVLLTRCNNLIHSRRALLEAKELPSRAVNLEDKEFLSRLSDLVIEHLPDSDLSNDSLAAMMHMSRSAFYTRFRKVTSETPGAYISNLRLQKSCDLLINHLGMSIADIAEHLGFNTQNYFCKRFKERYGVTPSQYRNKYLNEHKDGK